MRCRFIGEYGGELPAVDAAEMREVDRIAIEETGPNLFQMMENAGRNLAQAAMEMLGGLHRQCQIVILAGSGGNGGGGLTAGRHLLNHGTQDVTALLTDSTRMDEVPAQQLELFRHAGGIVIADDVPPTPVTEDVELIIDALIGYSLAGAPRGRALELIEWANITNVPILSLDVPSGLDATTGEAPGAVVEATRTLTLAAPKHGLCAPQAGDLVLADIGIPAEVYARLGRPEVRVEFDGRYRVPLQRRLESDE